ncbi:MAG: Uma2 family endonuclease [Oscillatoriales cyanobacterium C42_A2020_001]|nr:Uma2 family endonuclease [Leptolyngbyaceae cyanobacterium C42_A2020_001]
MIAIKEPKLFTFDEFLSWYPANSEIRYELHGGEIVEMPKPIGKHSKVAGFISGKLFQELDRTHSIDFIPKECVVKPSGDRSGYLPDVIVLNGATIDADPRWEKDSTITKGTSARVVIEVVSTNWEDDYALKLDDYETMGIPEYWIVDYLGLGGTQFIGKPKQPTISIYRLEEIYQVKQFRSSDRLVSPTFPDLQLTAEEIFRVGR